MNVSLNSVEKVKEFVQMTSKYDGEIDLVSGRFVIDAKSIMGIFSLDLSKPIRMKIYGSEEDSKIINQLKKFEA